MHEKIHTKRMASVRERATNAAQGHVFEYWDTLSPLEQQELLLSLQVTPIFPVY